jgi:predicted ATPase/DNA-binding winged helix-turn-helix (wHTH) protein
MKMDKSHLHKVYKFERFRLEAVELMLYRDGAEIPLPPKAVETLLILIESRGRILSKDELMGSIWGNVTVEESNLSQYLHILRKTLGDQANGKPFIETLRRRGYRFTGDVSVIEPAKKNPAGYDAPSPDSDERSLSSVPKHDYTNGISGQFTFSMASSHHLPIGREKELKNIAKLLMDSRVRLLTLTGVGGVGKTTLARSAAESLRDDFVDGIFFVELASTADPRLVVSTIALSLGVKEVSSKSILEILKDHFQELHTLLILDNFEHVISAANEIAELLAATRNLKILVTSRIYLHLSAETEFVVPSLAVPSESFLDQYIPAALKNNSVSSGISDFFNDILKYASVKLFVERAPNIQRDFVLNQDNAKSVAEICRRLEGLPLAIELAAARIKIMEPDAILTRLEHRLKLLTGGARDLPTRQQTMRGTIAWSYDLLEEKEKVLFRRLAVFTGGFTLDAAEAVADEVTIENTPFKNKTPITTDVIDGITALIDQHLLVSTEYINGDRCFRMLEVVREYALESLEESGELNAIYCRHAEFFLALSEEAEPHLQAAKSGEWLNRLEAEHDNLRAALRWAFHNDVQLCRRLASAIWRFWLLHGHVREGCEYLDKLLSENESDGGYEIRTKILLGAGFLHRLEGNFELAHSLAEEALNLARKSNDKKSIAFSLYQLGLLALNDSVNRAGQLFEEGLAYAADSNDKQILALLYNGLGEFARFQKNYSQAANFYNQAFSLNKEIGDLYRQVTNLVNLGATALSQKDSKAAGLFYKEGLSISSAMSDVRGSIYCLEGVAGAYWTPSDPERATVLLGAASASREAMSLPIEPADRPVYNQCVTLVRNALNEFEFANSFAAGRKMKLAEALAMALKENSVETIEKST